MDAGTLRCPSCGAPASIEDSRCGHCGSRLATVACPKCFGMIFVGSEYCPLCGARTKRPSEGVAGRPCPRCKAKMRRTQLGDTTLTVCDHCGGLWIDADSFEQICADRERESAVLAFKLPPALDPGDAKGRVFYTRCPVCDQMMNRVNFAHCSGVVIDICKKHGIWFDRDELRRIVEFIKGGGLEHSRQLREEALKANARRLADQTSSERAAAASSAWIPDEEDRHVPAAVSLLGGVLRFFLDA